MKILAQSLLKIYLKILLALYFWFYFADSGQPRLRKSQNTLTSNTWQGWGWGSLPSDICCTEFCA